MAQIDKPGLHFNNVLYTGNGSTQSITGVGFQPDWIWIKERSATSNHKINDVIRGTSKYLASDSSAAEDTTGAGIQSYDSDGFSISNATDINDNSQTYVAWNWKAGGTASSNTDGATTTNVSVNTTAGFSVFTFTGTGANTTVGHGLGAVPKMFIVKRYDASNNWRVYHHSLGNGNQLTLEQTSASASAAGFTNNTDPTSSVISLGNQGSSNASGGSMICYAFAEKKGYSSFGSYTANGNADGTFVYTGFKPAYLMIKKSSATENWLVVDNKRDTYNTVQNTIILNTTNSEFTGTDRVDFLSNGFKCRTATGGINDSGTFIYMAFAENPIVGSNNVPAVAR